MSLLTQWQTSLCCSGSVPFIVAKETLSHPASDPLFPDFSLAIQMSVLKPGHSIMNLKKSVICYIHVSFFFIDRGVHVSV